jgi:hypothetical protein
LAAVAAEVLGSDSEAADYLRARSSTLGLRGTVLAMAADLARPVFWQVPV